MPEVCEMTVIQHWCVIPEKISTHKKLETNLQGVGPLIFICTKTSAGAPCPDSSITLQGRSGLTGEILEKSGKNGQKSVRCGGQGDVKMIT